MDADGWSAPMGAHGLTFEFATRRPLLVGEPATDGGHDGALLDDSRPTADRPEPRERPLQPGSSRTEIRLTGIQVKTDERVFQRSAATLSGRSLAYPYYSTISFRI